MLWILETTKLKKYKHASSLQEKHKEKIGNNLLHGALLLLERMF